MAAACAKRLEPLTGVTVRDQLPRGGLPAGHRHLVFRWELQDVDFIARGEGAARIAPPDSARLDFFLGGGVGSGAAVLIRDRLQLADQGSDIARRVVPPVPLLWATLGRVALPALRDTAARRTGDTVRADLGQPVVWRVTFVRDTLRRIERVEQGRVLEWVERPSAGAGNQRVRYRHEGTRRQLDIEITRSTPVGAFDPRIFTLQ